MPPAKIKNFSLPEVRDLLDSGIQKGEITKDTVVYRGLKKEPKFANKIGFEFVDKGYTATSIQKIKAETFKIEVGFLYRIHLRKGQKAGFIGESIMKGDWMNEYEVLLPRNTKFRVTNFSEEFGRLIVDLEIVQ